MSIPPTKKFRYYQLDPDGVRVDGEPGRTSRWGRRPIMVQWRQTAPLPGDRGLPSIGWHTRRRYVTWKGAMRRARLWAAEHPWAEWRITEQLIPRRGKRQLAAGAPQWSQLCAACGRWGVWADAATVDASCVRCGAAAAPASGPQVLPADLAEL